MPTSTLSYWQLGAERTPDGPPWDAAAASHDSPRSYLSASPFEVQFPSWVLEAKADVFAYETARVVKIGDPECPARYTLNKPRRTSDHGEGGASDGSGDVEDEESTHTWETVHTSSDDDTDDPRSALGLGITNDMAHDAAAAWPLDPSPAGDAVVSPSPVGAPAAPGPVPVAAPEAAPTPPQLPPLQWDSFQRFSFQKPSRAAAGPSVGSMAAVAGREGASAPGEPAGGPAANGGPANQARRLGAQAQGRAVGQQAEDVSWAAAFGVPVTPTTAPRRDATETRETTARSADTATPAGGLKRIPSPATRRRRRKPILTGAHAPTTTPDAEAPTVPRTSSRRSDHEKRGRGETMQDQILRGHGGAVTAVGGRYSPQGANPRVDVPPDDGEGSHYRHHAEFTASPAHWHPASAHHAESTSSPTHWHPPSPHRPEFADSPVHWHPQSSRQPDSTASHAHWHPPSPSRLDFTSATPAHWRPPLSPSRAPEYQHPDEGSFNFSASAPSRGPSPSARSSFSTPHAYAPERYETIPQGRALSPTAVSPSGHERYDAIPHGRALSPSGYDATPQGRALSPTAVSPSGSERYDAMPHGRALSPTSLSPSGYDTIPQARAWSPNALSPSAHEHFEAPPYGRALSPTSLSPSGYDAIPQGRTWSPTAISPSASINFAYPAPLNTRHDTASTTGGYSPRMQSPYHSSGYPREPMSRTKAGESTVSERSHHTASTAHATSATERSSRATRGTSATSLDEGAEDEEPIVDEVMRMYEKGFYDDTDDDDDDEVEHAMADTRPGTAASAYSHGPGTPSSTNPLAAHPVHSAPVSPLSSHPPYSPMPPSLYPSSPTLRPDDALPILDPRPAFEPIPEDLPPPLRPARQHTEPENRDSAKSMGDCEAEPDVPPTPSTALPPLTTSNSHPPPTTEPSLQPLTLSTSHPPLTTSASHPPPATSTSLPPVNPSTSLPPPTPSAPPAEAPEEPGSRDRYGFKKANQHITREQYDAWDATYAPYLDRRRKKWAAFMKESNCTTERPNRFPPPGAKTKRFIRKGIPPEWRGAAWFYYAGGPAILGRHAGVYDSLIRRAPKAADADIIERDLHRTFPDNFAFRPPGTSTATGGSAHDPGSETPMISALRRVLSAFSIHNPRIGYCQSLNFIAGLLLLFVPTEEQAFWLLNVVTTTLLPGTHETNLEGSKVDLGVLMTALRSSMPELWQKLAGDEAEGVRPGTARSVRKGRGRRRDAAPISKDSLPPITITMTAWFMSCFIGTLPIESTLRVWDVFFYEGSKTLFRIALAVLKMGEGQIMAVDDPMEMFSVVQGLPRSLLDANELIETCFRRRNGFGHLGQGQVDDGRREMRGDEEGEKRGIFGRRRRREVDAL